jgi:hypothetical protein
MTFSVLCFLLSVTKVRQRHPSSLQDVDSRSNSLTNLMDDSSNESLLSVEPPNRVITLHLLFFWRWLPVDFGVLKLLLAEIVLHCTVYSHKKFISCSLHRVNLVHYQKQSRLLWGNCAFEALDAACSMMKRSF